ncbi:MAG: DUF58 domain-containing protein [Betaproteobacteria bacterium]|nr:DUF58 domain-containing protein [Betaproteobacteria bacterium]MDH3438387.1 DUF58 domain-containing protein [Betaproteobacteria bacterium]
MYAALRNQFQRWLFQLRGPETGVIVLVQRRIFILPTRHGLMFAAMLMLMLTGSINYSLSLGFILTFLLGAMGVNTIIYTYRNLANLRVAGGRARPVFAGDTAHFTVHLENIGDTPRYAVNLTHDKREWETVDIPARTTVSMAAGVPARRRGLLRPGRLTLFTRYPLGLVYAWAYLDLDLRCLVYPRPASPGLPLPAPAMSAGAGSERGTGQEDFSGMRQYHVGDSPRHIAWKLAARAQGLLTKQFSGRAEAELWLDWSVLPAAMGPEEKLSHLARWVIDAHETGLSFGLRLPGKTVEMANADAQRECCLEALALFESAVAKE